MRTARFLSFFGTRKETLCALCTSKAHSNARESSAGALRKIAMEKIKPTRLKDEEPAEEQTDAAALPPTPLPSPVADGPTSAWDRVRPNLPGAVVSKRSGTLTPPRVTRGGSSGSLYSPRIKRNGSSRSLTSLRENTAAWSAQLHGIVNSIDAVWMQSQQRRGAKWVSADSEARTAASSRDECDHQTRHMHDILQP